MEVITARGTEGTKGRPYLAHWWTSGSYTYPAHTATPRRDVAEGETNHAQRELGFRDAWPGISMLKMALASEEESLRVAWKCTIHAAGPREPIGCAQLHKIQRRFS